MFFFYLLYTGGGGGGGGGEYTGQAIRVLIFSTTSFRKISQYQKTLSRYD